ncbi:winged helix-turn-helix transcriptional regulator [Yinghuangia sp. YIM S10712]|uniref:winged helix-turn-helix transcriptional regulator n=1 Tax=Yinghuangia sp. YIM S10712 TaxID=3436930 RepID=UPI003F533D09
MIGDRWALLVVRELRLGARRYSDLQAALPAIGPSVLAQRLKDLESVGVVQKRDLPRPASAKVYELTSWGAELEPVFAALRVWGMRSPVVPLDGELTADTVLLGMRAYFVPQPDSPWTATYRIELERDVYRIDVTDGRLTSVTRGDVSTPADTSVTATQVALQDVFAHRSTVAGAVSSGQLRVTGNEEALHRLVAALPERRPQGAVHQVDPPGDARRPIPAGADPRPA